jgi:hypothetical protein
MVDSICRRMCVIWSILMNSTRIQQMSVGRRSGRASEARRTESVRLRRRPRHPHPLSAPQSPSTGTDVNSRFRTLWTLTKWLFEEIKPGTRPSNSASILPELLAVMRSPIGRRLLIETGLIAKGPFQRLRTDHRPQIVFMAANARNFE